jgi:hypothetical protein
MVDYMIYIFTYFVELLNTLVHISTKLDTDTGNKISDVNFSGSRISQQNVKGNLKKLRGQNKKTNKNKPKLPQHKNIYKRKSFSTKILPFKPHFINKIV